jgi:hypothetical protein
MIGSVIVAVIIVIVTVAVVTAKLGPEGDELLEDRERQEEDDNSGSGSYLRDLDRVRLALISNSRGGNSREGSHTGIR